VTRCTELIAGTIAGLPWEVVRYRDQNATELVSAADILPAPDWVGDPQGLRADRRIMARPTDDANLSAVDFWAGVITSALWWGDGYVYVPSRAVDGTPLPPLYPLHPDDVAIDTDGRYYAGDGTPFGTGDIIHLRGAPPYWHGHGHGVLTRHLIDLGLAVTIRQYTASQYRSGVPAGYLQSTQPHMTDEDARALKQTWMNQHGRRRSIAVLNATTSFTPIQTSPVDAALDQARRWSTTDIANAFGVPGYMLGGDVGTSNTYANAESRAIDFVAYTLRPWIRRIESTLSAEFPRGTVLRVNTDETERATTADRNATLVAQLNAGIITVDEFRRLMDYPTGAGAVTPPALPGLPASSSPQPPIPVAVVSEPPDTADTGNGGDSNA
jgi:HK97 family phage portal protein